VKGVEDGSFEYLCPMYQGVLQLESVSVAVAELLSMLSIV
jgi:hypothetical protein